MHTRFSAPAIADFGMALPYFIEIVELKETNAVYGPAIANSFIGQVFGEQAVMVTGIAPDGQRWRAIYPHESSACWAMPALSETPLPLGDVAGDGMDSPLHFSS